MLPDDVILHSGAVEYQAAPIERPVVRTRRIERMRSVARAAPVVTGSVAGCHAREWVIVGAIFPVGAVRGILPLHGVQTPLPTCN